MSILRKKVLIIDNSAHHAYSQRHLISAYLENNFEVILLIPNDGNYFCKIQSLGLRCINLKISSGGLNPFVDYLLILRMRSLFKKISLNLICSFTIKCNFYASLSAKKLNIPIIANITGLGYAFKRKSLLMYIVIKLYKGLFKTVDYVFFQNQDDINLLIKYGIKINSKKMTLLPGDGVDLNTFKFVGYNLNQDLPSRSTVFLYSGRLLWDKGVGELISAYSIVKMHHPEVQLKFIGNFYPDSPTSIQPQEFEKLQQEVSFEYLGMVDNVAEVIANVDCVVLPSYYREGVPRAILEASSVGKVIIASNFVGCNKVIVDGITGFVCEIKNVVDLSEQMLKVINLSALQKQQMGISGRQKIEQEFDQKIVISKYLEISIKLCL